MAPDHITANVSSDGNSEQAAAVLDVVQHSPTRVSGEIDFSGEAAQLAEAILKSREDDQQISEPTAPTGEQHQRNSEFAPAHPEVESLPVPGDARRDQKVGRPAQTELQEERGIPRSSQEISATAAPGEASDDTLPDQQGKASSDYRQTSGNSELVGTTCLGISEGLEPVKVQPAANACPHTGHDSADDSINDDLASGRPEAVARDATSTLLQRRTSMRSGSLEAYERGRKSGIWHGAANANMGALEQDWDSYKATSVRGWTMPSLQDVQAKSEALALSGFTVVSSPRFRASSRSKLQVENKRKAGVNVPDEAAAPRKAPKVADMPRTRQVAPAKGRCWAASPSRFKQSASSLPAPKGKSGTKSESRTGGAPMKPLGERIPRPQMAV
ncbi:g8986 [Coccomyxa elongata]